MAFNVLGTIKDVNGLDIRIGTTSDRLIIEFFDKNRFILSTASSEIMESLLRVGRREIERRKR